MPHKPVAYIRLQSGDALPDIGNLQPFKAIVVIEEEVSQIWQWDVSRWLVRSGCRYMMAWGIECSSWDDSVDEATLEAFDYGDVPDENFVMSTWHDKEPLSEVFWYAKNSAQHPVHPLQSTIILHISTQEKQAEMEAQYENA